MEPGDEQIQSILAYLLEPAKRASENNGAAVARKVAWILATALEKVLDIAAAEFPSARSASFTASSPLSENLAKLRVAIDTPVVPAAFATRNSPPQAPEPVPDPLAENDPWVTKPEANTGMANNQRQDGGNSGKSTQDPWKWYWPTCGATEAPPSSRRTRGNFGGQSRTEKSNNRPTTTYKCVVAPGLPARQQAANERGIVETEARKVKHALDGTGKAGALEVITHRCAPPGLEAKSLDGVCTPGPLETDDGWEEAAVSKKKDAWHLAEQRRALSAKAYDRKIKATIAIQSALRGRLARRFFSNACTAISLLQVFWRKRRCDEPAPCAKVAAEMSANELSREHGLAKAPEPKRVRNKTKVKKGKSSLDDDDDFLKQALLQAQTEEAAFGEAAKLEVLALGPVIAKQRAVCPEGHPLVACAVTVARGKACWKCNAFFPAGGVEANCATCDFSLCKICVATFGGGDGAQTGPCSCNSG